MYSIQEGNAALPRELAAAAKLQALHIGTALQAVQRDANGQYTLLAVRPTPSTAAADVDAATAAATHTAKNLSAEQTEQVLAERVGPFDGVILATPLEGSGIELRGVLPPAAVLPRREYQSTVTTYVTGALNPRYFKVRTPTC